MTTVLEATTSPTLVTDVNGAIQFLNAAAEQLLKRKLADVAGLQWHQLLRLFEPKSNIQAIDLVAVALRRATALKLLPGTVLRNGPGRDCPVEGEVAPSYMQGNPAGAVLTIRDVSKRVQEEAKDRQNERMLAVERLAGGIAHDINNLLTVIIGHASLLLEEMPDLACLDSIKAILAAADRAETTGKQLLTLGRRQVLTTEVLNVNRSIAHAAQSIVPSLGPGIQLTMNLDQGTGAVRMNAAQIEQVLLNLALNARDAMPGGGAIVISTSRLDRTAGTPGAEKGESFVRITVADSGEGIPDEIRDHLFEPFFTTKACGKGTGLGLAIVYGAVKDAGGEIEVQSIPGAGTTFEILVPRLEEGPPRATAGPSGTPASCVVNKTVLLVDDEGPLRDLIGNYLQKNGFALLVAENGQEALELADLYEGTIDVLVSDVLMPKMDGVTLSLRLAERRPGMKALFISGFPGHRIEALKHAEPNSEFVPKPFLLSNLLARIQALAA